MSFGIWYVAFDDGDGMIPIAYYESQRRAKEDIKSIIKEAESLSIKRGCGPERCYTIDASDFRVRRVRIANISTSRRKKAILQSYGNPSFLHSDWLRLVGEKKYRKMKAARAKIAERMQRILHPQEESGL